jgi:hypothetical protein
LAEIWNDLTFEGIQSVLLKGQIRLNLVTGNGGEYYSELSDKTESLFGRHSQGILSARLFGQPVYQYTHQLDKDSALWRLMLNLVSFPDPLVCDLSPIAQIRKIIHRKHRMTELQIENVFYSLARTSAN